ncbi:MAG: hypothetical protein O4861_01690 [Trichodesmium sp. St16_bin4-tuft]|nr:hypothetical protein [Trichodesmium sp. St5_bin8]MDE5097117.1 hypothetical protein [Trichodesmium sp. St16_bin4-tuft]MDE5105379.1 hypothetical protein [Trichodesmium sp. St19_bin2]
MFKGPRIWGMWMYVSALKLESRELLIVVRARPGASGIQDYGYGHHWQIETLFGCFKSRDFDL